MVFGDSQSSSILTHEKRDLAGLSATDKGRLTFELLANPNRPNGGLLQRFAPFTIPIIDLTGSGATPTNTGITTIDIAFQYDAIADFPRYPLNLLADLNMLAGANIHSSYMTGLNSYTEAELIQAVNDPANRQTYQDTTYITIPAKHLPLVVPLLASRQGTRSERPDDTDRRPDRADSEGPRRTRLRPRHLLRAAGQVRPVPEGQAVHVGHGSARCRQGRH